MQWWTQIVIILFCNLLYPAYIRTYTQLNKIGLSLFRYLRFFHYYWADTSAGELLVSNGITLPPSNNNNNNNNNNILFRQIKHIHIKHTYTITIYIKISYKYCKLDSLG